MQRTIQGLLAASLVLTFVQSAAAQSALTRPWEDRAFASLSFGVQAASKDLSDSSTFPIYGEQATILTNSSFGADGFVDFNVGARVWRNLGVAIGYHTVSSTGSGDVQGSVPHPQFFDRPRSFALPLDGIDRNENAVHLTFGWMIPVNDKLDVYVSGGPSFFHLEQEVVSAVSIGEQGFPFDTVIAEPTIDTRKDSPTGINIGADATYFLYTTDRYRLGVGGFFRYTGATATIQMQGGDVETKVGGPQFGFGARVRF